MQSQGQKDGHPVWSYDLSANEGEFAAAEFAVAPVKLQSWRATGRVLPHRGEIEVADFNLKAGGAEIAMKGDFVAGADPASTRLEGNLSPMPLDTLKALWPKAIAPGAREWVGERVAHANFLGGTFRFVSGAGMEPGEAGRRTRRASPLAGGAGLRRRDADHRQHAAGRCPAAADAHRE